MSASRLTRGLARGLTRGLAAASAVLIALLGGGCATTGHWTAAEPAPTDVPVVAVASPVAAAALLSLPGDLLLLHLGDSRMGSWVKQLGMYPGGAVDLLDLQDPYQKYLHSEVITGVRIGSILETRGFYPIVKKYYRNQYRRSFATFAVRGSPASSPVAIRRGLSNDYLPLGYCGDFAAWCHRNKIYSWWNRAPGLQKVIGTLYPFAAIHTADKIAQSPDTTLLFEVRDNHMLYPDRVNTGQLLHRLEEGIATGHPGIADHARGVRRFLVQRGILAADGRVLHPEFRFELPDFDSPELSE